MKNVIVGVSLAGTAAFVLSMYSGKIGLCPHYAYSSCALIADTVAEIIFPSPILFLFSLITYFMRENVFRLWAKVALPLTLVSMLLIYLTPEQYAAGFGPQLSVGKGDTALIMTALLVIVSTALIVAGYVRGSRKV